MLDVIPAILTNDPAELEKKIRLLEKTGLVDRLQLDIHLMCNDPEAWVERALASMPDRLIAQIEKMPSQEDFAFGQTAISGARVGLALDLVTPVSALDLTL